jgi:3-oxoacyl-[acyl-carrier-protein] synthase-3
MEAGSFRKPKSAETAKPVFDEKGNPRWPEYVHMDGMEIMNFALTQVPILINETLEYVGWKKEEVGVFAMHQANQLILQFLAKRLKIPPENMPITMKNMGNTVSASVPLMLAQKYEELKKNDALKKVIICGFGVGLSWGTVATDLSSTVIHDTWTI